MTNDRFNLFILPLVHQWVDERAKNADFLWVEQEVKEISVSLEGVQASP